MRHPPDPIECEANNGTWIDDEFVQCQEQYGTICSNVTDNMPSDRPPDVLDEFAGFDWLVAGVYFEGLGRNFVDEFKEGGCVNEFNKAVDAADILAPLSAAPNIIEDTLKSAASGAAFNYAAQRALTYPLRSATVRTILGTGTKIAGRFVPVYFFYLTVRGAYAEGKALIQGTCK
ncbi:MAG: hypothetical protein WAR21_12765 [Candidatus Acidiferrales bacterium]